MTKVDGDWEIEISTPMGIQRFKLELSETETRVDGTATNNSGRYPIESGELHGSRLTFGVSVSSPFPLSLTFDLAAGENTLTGDSKAGPFAPSPVVGRRITLPENLAG